jgi:hypothetical protein
MRSTGNCLEDEKTSFVVRPFWCVKRCKRRASPGLLTPWNGRQCQEMPSGPESGPRNGELLAEEVRKIRPVCRIHAVTEVR